MTTNDPTTGGLVSRTNSLEDRSAKCDSRTTSTVRVYVNIVVESSLFQVSEEGGSSFLLEAVF